MNKLEMPTPSPNLIKRRRFLGLAAGGVAAFALVPGRKLLRDFDFLSDERNILEGARPLAEHLRPPKSLRGVGVNSLNVYLYDEDIQHHAVSSCQSLGGKHMRIFVDDWEDPLEARPGIYNKGQIEKIRRFCELVATMDPTISVTLDVFDFYPFVAATPNGVYGAPSGFSTPYLEKNTHHENPQIDFFLNPEKFALYSERTRFVVNMLADIPNLVAFGVANEFHLPPEFGSVQKREMTTEWFAKAAATIRAVAPRRVIYTGTRHPLVIDEGLLSDTNGLINTAHPYPMMDFDWDGLTAHLPKMRLPLLIQELGIPTHIYYGKIPVPSDELLVGLMKKTLSHLTYIDEKGTRRIASEHFAPWKAHSGHPQDYFPNPADLPASSLMLRKLSSVITNL